jgi:hypothetical protein
VLVERNLEISRKEQEKVKIIVLWPNFIHLLYSIVYGNNEEEQEQFSIQNKDFLY